MNKFDPSNDNNDPTPNVNNKNVFVPKYENFNRVLNYKPEKLLKSNDFYNDLCLKNDMFQLENLPFSQINPVISKETLEYHHGKHHKAYVDNLNKLKDKFEQLRSATNNISCKVSSNLNQDHKTSCDTNHKTSCGDKKKKNFIHEFYFTSIKYLNKLSNLPANYQSLAQIQDQIKLCENIYNNSGQCLNHSFYWKSITQESTNSNSAMQTILKHFANYEDFVSKFLEKVTHFGSSWIWLVQDMSGKIFFYSTSNAINPLEYGLFPIFTCDIWEHAYYIDYRNLRLKYCEEFLKILNWQFIEENLKAADKFFEFNTSNASNL